MDHGQAQPKMDAQKAKMEAVKAQSCKMDAPKAKKEAEKLKWRPTRPKWKEMKAQKAKMKGNEGWQARKLEIDSATALINSLYGTLGKRTVFGNVWGGAHGEGRHKKKCY